MSATLRVPVDLRHAYSDLNETLTRLADVHKVLVHPRLGQV